MICRREHFFLLIVAALFCTWCITCSLRLSSFNPKNWFPSDRRKLAVNSFGFLDLTLRPQVKLHKDGYLESEVHYSLLRRLYTGKIKSTNTFENIALMDRAVRIKGSTPDFNLYPQVMDMRKTVAAVKSGNPVDEAPTNDPEVLAVTSPTVTCESKDLAGKVSTYPLDLVIIIKSCVTCFQNRERARTTFLRQQMWGEFQVRFMFVVGLPQILSSPLITVNGIRIMYQKARLTNKKELKTARERLFRESSEHGDLLIGGFLDSYYNLTLKMILTFRWASTFCLKHTPVFLFMDDDFAVVPANMVSFVRGLTCEQKLSLIGGISFVPEGPFRPSPDPRKNHHASTYEQYPWTTLPGYLLGGAYMVGSDRVGDAAIAMAFTRTYHIDDMFLGIVWSKLHYVSLIIPGFVVDIRNHSQAIKTIATRYRLVERYFSWNSSAYWVRES